MKLKPATKLEKKTATSKKFDDDTMMSCWQRVTSLSFFRFMTKLKLSGSRIPDAWSVKLTFSFIVTFYLTKSENITEKSLAQLSNYCFE